MYDDMHEFVDLAVNADLVAATLRLVSHVDQDPIGADVVRRTKARRTGAAA